MTTSFPIVNFPFISSNFPAAPEYGVYLSQLLHYSKACAQLLMQKLLKQGYIAPRLKSLLQNFYEPPTRLLTDLIIGVTWWTSSKKQVLFTLHNHMGSPQVLFMRSVFWFCLRSVSVQCFPCLLIVHFCRTLGFL
jgi:hypothetical protein